MASKAATDVGWVLDRFVTETPGVLSAQTVSSDGIHLAGSSSLSEIACDQMAAICSGLSSLTDSAAEVHGILPVSRMLVETDRGWIIISRVSNRAVVAVVAAKNADLGMVGFEMTALAQSAGQMLSPEVIAELKNTLAL